MAIDNGWRSQSPGAETVEKLVSRIDEIRQTFEYGSADEARKLAFGRKWLNGVDSGAIPPEVLERGQAWLDAAYDALRQPFVCASTVQRALIMARREISG